MSYMDFKPTVKKVNMKPKGVVEIVLETTISDLNGKVEALGNMIDRRAEASLDSLVVNYNVVINTRTNKPVVNYKVDESGIVHEVKPEGEQLEADLGMPQEKIPTEEESKEAERSVIDDFIREGFAPQFDDLPYDFQSIVSRKLAGETYMKIASELEMSSGKIAELVDQYRARVAPMALKWDEWRKSKEKQKASKEKADNKPSDQVEPGTQNKQQPDNPEAQSATTPETEVKEDNIPESEQTGFETSGDKKDEEPQGSEKQDEVTGAIDKDKLVAFILSGQAPAFDEVEYDFPALLARKQNGETWIKIASSIGTSSTKLQAAWAKYKKLVSEHMAKNGEEPGAA
ncbi:hypothetical protein [Brevibacillus brevis]|uniref:hypothetical protein n=1 Tax=Brevibacillus brevis TaxID=1393 RepID=UPI000D0FF3B2|nr:hypothetical protein [Brevibacillus brevis]PSJ66317.1 hypothetical protein C7J99_26640 [Brevibacillus brevis]RED21830.1 hypothetical protein DES34_11895 [Brevibacillus brevis]GEC93070.1 hypothetical protein BBR01nite_54010 [Brevibacillus brevis]VEF92693.1 Uncharacterised protein [Brevibacillus brevis]